MRIFLRNCFIFITVIICILSLLGYAVDAGLRKSRAGNFSEWNDIRNGINADLIILGSSRARVQVSPMILDTMLRLNSYNLGLYGHQFKAQSIRYNYYKKFNGPPKYLVHVVDCFTLSKRPDLYMPDQFAPYLSDTIIANGTREYIGYSFIDYYNPFTKYQYQTKTISLGLLELFSLKRDRYSKYKGYEGKDRGWDGSFEKIKKQRPGGWTQPLDTPTIEAFDAYLAESKRNGIRFVMAYPPEYYEVQGLVKNHSEILSWYKFFSEKYDIPFLDYSKDELGKSKQYYYNSQHFNRIGAEKFTYKLASDLQRIWPVDLNRKHGSFAN